MGHFGDTLLAYALDARASFTLRVWTSFRASLFNKRRKPLSLWSDVFAAGARTEAETKLPH